LQKANTLERKEIIAEQRKITLEIAIKKYLTSRITIYRKEIGVITFTKKGLKESINQPFVEYLAKLELIRGDLLYYIENGNYLGCSPNTKHKNEHIIRFHYIGILIADEPSQIVISEDKWGNFTFYSITEQKTD